MNYLKSIYGLVLINFIGIINIFSQLNYKYILNDIKDHIIIQSLLTENRNSELNYFFEENGYSKLNENNNSRWIKLEQFNSFSRGESDIFGVFVIEDDVDREGFSNFKVNIFYQINDGSEIRKLNKSESLMLKNVIYEKLDAGFAYNIFKKFYETENQDVKDHIIVIDDRTVKSFNEKSQSYDTYKCSNFMFMSTAINKGFSFFGPEAKYSWLEFGFYPMELESGELLVHFYSIASLNDEDLKNRNFDIRKFQSSKGLNDIIWQKERF